MTHWAYSAITEAHADGAVNGTGNNTYNPAGNVTLAQFIAILTRAFYPEDVENVTSSIVYYNPGYSWYEPNYSIAADLGLFKNIPNTAPGTQVTREVMAQIMYNLMAAELTREVVDSSLSSSEIQAAKNKIPGFGSVGSSYGDAVAMRYALGLITGIDSAGRFSPQGRMNRAQTAVIYVRLKQVMETGEGLANQTGTSAETSNGTLTNGKSVTVDNVLALIEEYKNGKAPVWEKAIKAGFTSYAPRSTYDAYEPKYYLAPFGSGIECAKFAFAFWDELFGDLPIREVTSYEDIRPGDLIHWDGHWAIAATSAYIASDGELRVWDVGGGSAGLISWSTVPGWLESVPVVGLYTRYPK